MAGGGGGLAGWRASPPPRRAAQRAEEGGPFFAQVDESLHSLFTLLALGCCCSALFRAADRGLSLARGGGGGALAPGARPSCFSPSRPGAKERRSSRGREASQSLSLLHNSFLTFALSKKSRPAAGLAGRSPARGGERGASQRSLPW